MIRYSICATIALVALGLPGVSGALVFQINDSDYFFDQPPLVKYHAGQRLLVIDSDADYQCFVDGLTGVETSNEGLRLLVDGANMGLQGNISLSLDGELPRLSMKTADGAVTCARNRIFRDRFVAASP